MAANTGQRNLMASLGRVAPALSLAAGAALAGEDATPRLSRHVSPFRSSARGPRAAAQEDSAALFPDV